MGQTTFIEPLGTKVDPFCGWNVIGPNASLPSTFSTNFLSPPSALISKSQKNEV